MGYKTINLRTQVLKGSVTPSKVFEEQRNQQRQQKKLQQQQKHARNDIGCCERLNVNLHRWLETKFSMCPVSCFPFKLGDSKSSSSNKNNKRSSVESVQPGKQQRKESNEKPIYVDCSDLYLWEYDTDIISLNKHHHSAVIDRDVNNSFKFIPSKTTSSNKTHEHHHYNHHNHNNPHKQAQVTPNKQSTSKRKREHQQQKQQRMNKSPSIKAKFEKRLGRMKKMSDENRISENDGDERTMASREKMKKESVVSAMSTRSKDSVVTFSSIFGDASLFDTDEARIEEESENSSYHIVDETDLENPIESIHSSENDRFEVIHDKDDTDEMFEEHVELKIEREYEDQEAAESQLDHRRRCCESTNFQSQEEQDHYEDDFEDDENEEGFEEEGEIYQFSDDTETSSSEISQTEYF